MKTNLSAIIVLCLIAAVARASTPYPMASGDYFENFNTVTNWTDGFVSPTEATRWSAVLRNPGVGIPNPTNVLEATTNFATTNIFTSGVQRGTNPSSLILFATGPTTDNTNSTAVDLLLDFSGCRPGTLSFDWAVVNNSTGDRASSLRIYAATNAFDFIELPGAAVLNKSNNTAATGSIIAVPLPTSFSNSPTARLRFYQYNGTGGSTGSRSRIGLSDVAVTSTRLLPDAVTLSATGMSNTVATLNGAVNPGPFACTAWFEYGVVSGYFPQQTAPVSVGSGTSPLALSDGVTGLIAGMTYRCRLVASNVAGLVRGAEVPFGSPAILFNSGAVLTNECHFTFTDPTTAFGAPLALDGGGYHSLALRSDGTVTAWGGAGGDPAVTNIPPGLSNVLAIGAGYFHNVALKSDGTVIGWPSSAPVGLSNVVAISAGSYHSLALRNDGTVAAWGDNGYGQSSVPFGLSNVMAIAGGGNFSAVLKRDSTVVAWGDNSYGVTTVPVGLSNVVAIAAGDTHCLALKGDGTIVGWGDASVGQLPVPAGLSNVVALAAGGGHSLALRSDGTFVVWGFQGYSGGITNPPPGLSNVVAVAVGALHSLVIKSDGSVVSWGDSTHGETNVPPGLGLLNLASSGNLNTNSPGSYTLNYTSSDSLGGIATASRSVVVADTIPPVITMLGENPIHIASLSDLPLVDPGATASDLCNGSLSVVTSNAVNVNFPGKYAITYRATDASGNTGTASRTVYVALPPAVPGDRNGDGLVSQAELDAVYAAYLPTSPWLLMTNLAGLGSSQVTFSLSNSVLGAYMVEYTTNFTTWQALGPATPRYEFTDTNAPGPQRYYRLRYP